MKPIIAGGDGNSHWYECVCGEPINPYVDQCPTCGVIIEWKGGEQE